jgi:hypothetical protein
MVTITDSKIDNGINAVSAFTDGAITGLRFTTNAAHDITMGYTDQIELRGFTNTALNGLFDIYGVPSRTTFEIVFATVPTLNGSEVLREDREIGLNGRHLITKIVDINTFQIALTGLPTFDLLAVPIIKLAKGFRMQVASDWNRAKNLYTDQTLPYLFVIMDDAKVSKDRAISNDATSVNNPQTALRLRIINKFAIDVIIPTKDDMSGSLASETCWTTILAMILNVMYGKKLQTMETTEFLVGFVDHGSLEYNTAFYGHGYSFEYVYDITSIDSFAENFMKTINLNNIDISGLVVQEGL